MHLFGDFADEVGTVVDSVGVLVMVTGAIRAFVRVFRRHPENAGHRYQNFRQDLGRAILVGLELMIAADIIRTVAVAPTLLSVSILGTIVLIRTFLSWSLEVEIEGRWPWQEPRAKRD
jgi:uncharacterized membrane protein